MGVIERVLGDGTIEKRFYDENQKLVDIRKTPPPQKPAAINRIPTKHGASGGHEH